MTAFVYLLPCRIYATAGLQSIFWEAGGSVFPFIACIPINLKESKDFMIYVPLIIIGAGPAGLLSAISAGRVLRGKAGSILVLDANSEAGAKLLLSGSGQCNFTNNAPDLQFLTNCKEFANYLKPAYYEFNNLALLNFVEEAGCPVFIRQDGKVFPKTMKAGDLRDTLLAQAAKLHIDFSYNSRVTGISKRGDSGFVLHLESGKTIGCAKLIIATGGASYPQTGSDGRALNLLKSLGHHPIHFRAHLTNLIITDYARFSHCAGVSLQAVKVKFKQKQSSFVATGDLLFTHTGLSGPVIMDNCHKLASGDTVSLCLVAQPEILFTKLRENSGKQKLLKALKVTSIPESLLIAMFSRAGIPLETPVGNLGRDTQSRICDMLSELNFHIASVGGINAAMASAGGIPFTEIRIKSMESRLCPGLYFAGEILDYALPTGGYN
ncbi:MAG: aminoacetone oxidase family FAD-binding enzyme, partial [Candidatus Cloacimonetes bacterium]|nr:aminoacetone oxidase family FAD-binding enzyme [Candidatus Cloacimonadota bacterium]